MLGPSDETFLREVCIVVQGPATCRFLVLSTDGFECAKGTIIERVIRNRALKMRAQGDNCSGPPSFEEAEE